MHYFLFLRCFHISNNPNIAIHNPVNGAVELPEVVGRVFWGVEEGVVDCDEDVSTLVGLEVLDVVLVVVVVSVTAYGPGRDMRLEELPKP